MILTDDSEEQADSRFHVRVAQFIQSELGQTRFKSRCTGTGDTRRAIEADAAFRTDCGSTAAQAPDRSSATSGIAVRAARVSIRRLKGLQPTV